MHNKFGLISNEKNLSYLFMSYICAYDNTATHTIFFTEKDYIFQTNTNRESIKTHTISVCLHYVIFISKHG